MTTEPVDLSNEAYHSLPALSASGAKTLLQPGGPAKYRWLMDNRRERPTKDVWDEGHAIHHFVFGSDPAPVVVEADSWRTNAAKERRDEIRAEGGVPLLQKDYDRCQNIGEKVLENPDARSLLFSPDGTRRGAAEEPLFWHDPDTGIPLRARPDWHSDDWSIILDLKSTADASADGFARSVYKFAYDVQQEIYRAAVRKLHGVDAAFVFLCVEVTPPYLTQCHMLDDTYSAIGHARYRRAVELWRDCTAADAWPGYPTGWGKAKLSPPKYVTYLEEDYSYADQ